MVAKLAAGGNARRPVLAPKPASIRLLSQAAPVARQKARAAGDEAAHPGQARENWVYALLTVLSSLTLGYQLWHQFQTAGQGENFIQFVRQLLA